MISGMTANWLQADLILYATAIGLVVIGALGMAFSTHLFRSVLALVIAESGANLLLVLAGFRWDAIAPILDGATVSGAVTEPMVDPVPQAMVLTAIVIGVGVQALALSLLIRVQRAYGTLNVAEVRRRMQAEINQAAGLGPDSGEHAPEGERPLTPQPVVPAHVPQAFRSPQAIKSPGADS